MPVDLITDETVRTTTRQVLERPEYAAWQGNAWLRDLFEWIGRLHVTDPVLFWTIVAALTALLLLVVAHVVWTVRKALAMQPPEHARDSRASAPRFAEEAAALAERGCFLDAARTMQLGAIHLLVERDGLRLGRGDANRVLRRELVKAPLAAEVRDELLAVIAGLERSWFRDRHEDESLYRRWRDAYGALCAGTAGG